MYVGHTKRGRNARVTITRDMVGLQKTVQPERRSSTDLTPDLDYPTMERSSGPMPDGGTGPSAGVPRARAKRRHRHPLHRRLGKERGERVCSGDRKRPWADQNDIPSHDRMGKHVSGPVC